MNHHLCHSLNNCHLRAVGYDCGGDTGGMIAQGRGFVVLLSLF